LIFLSFLLRILAGHQYHLVTIDDEVNVEGLGYFNSNIYGDADYTLFVFVDVLLSNVLRQTYGYAQIMLGYTS
jgi:hypothetical protein